MPVIIVLLLATLFWPAAASAYVSPGLGMGVFSLVFGVIGAIFLVLVSIVYYPIKRMLRASRRSKTEGSQDSFQP